MCHVVMQMNAYMLQYDLYADELTASWVRSVWWVIKVLPLYVYSQQLLMYDDVCVGAS